MALANLLALLPDNATGAITPADLRTIVTELYTDPLSPVLASAQLYIDAIRNDGSGVNEGTAGSALDAAVAYLDGSEKAHVGAAGADAFAAQTADAAGLDLTGDFCIAVDVSALWAPPLPCQFVSKEIDDPDSTDDCFAFGIGTTGVPFVEFTRDGETAHEDYSFLISDGADIDIDYSGDTGRKRLILEFDADNGAGGWTAKLYTGSPGASPTLVSTIVNTTDGAVTLETSSVPLVVAKPLYGGVYRARLYSGRLASPTLRAEFYPERDHTSGAAMTAGGTTSEGWTGLAIVDSASFAAAVVPDGAALDVAADADATIAFWFTTPRVSDVDGEQYLYASHATGTLGANGLGFNLTDWLFSGFGIDFAGSVVGDGTDQALVKVDAQHWTAGTHLAVLTIDRAADDAILYVDGVEWATAGIAAVGALNPAADLLLQAAGHHAVAKWGTVVAPALIASAR